MYWLYFALAMVTPVCLFAVGLLWRLSPPPFRAGGLAYRTSLTCKSQEAWAFAHTHCAKLWLRLGLLLGLVSAALMLLLPAYCKTFLVWLIAAQMAFFCVSAFLVDTLLKTAFDENGVRISD
jgi:uncharacterized membrane protein